MSAQKRFDFIEITTIGASGQAVATITAQEGKANFHNIRCNGRIRADNTTADNAARGSIVLGYFPDAKQGAPTASEFDTTGELEDASPYVIAHERWAVFGGSTNPVGEGVIYDFELAVKSSRNVANGGRLFLLILSDSGSSKNVIADAAISCLETQL